jgi:hypothetical protein
MPVVRSVPLASKAIETPARERTAVARIVESANLGSAATQQQSIAGRTETPSPNCAGRLARSLGQAQRRAFEAPDSPANLRNTPRGLPPVLRQGLAGHCGHLLVLVPVLGLAFTVGRTKSQRRVTHSSRVTGGGCCAGQEPVLRALLGSREDAAPVADFRLRQTYDDPSCIGSSSRCAPNRHS